MQEFLRVAKCTSVNRGNKLISSSLLFIRNEKLVNELGEVANSGYEGFISMLLRAPAIFILQVSTRLVYESLIILSIMGNIVYVFHFITINSNKRNSIIYC